MDGCWCSLLGWVRKRLGAGRNQGFSLRETKFKMFVKHSNGDVNWVNGYMSMSLEKSGRLLLTQELGYKLG